MDIEDLFRKRSNHGREHGQYRDKEQDDHYRHDKEDDRDRQYGYDKHDSHNRHEFDLSHLRQYAPILMAHKKIVVIAAIVLAILGIVALLVLLPLAWKLVGYIGQTGIGGIAEALWKGTAEK
jgi:hypothetical protein